MLRFYLSRCVTSYFPKCSYKDTRPVYYMNRIGTRITSLYAFSTTKVPLLHECIDKKRHKRPYINMHLAPSMSFSNKNVSIENGDTYWIKQILHSDHEPISVIRNTIKSAAELGNNVGRDEYDEDKITRLISHSEVYSVEKANSPGIIGFLFLRPSPYCRRLLAHVGFFQIIIAHDNMINCREMYKELVKVCVRLTIGSSRGYVGVMTSVYSTCVEWVEELRRQHFLVTATLPCDGSLLDGDHQDSYLLFRQFSGEEIRGKVGILMFTLHIMKTLCLICY